MDMAVQAQNRQSVAALCHHVRLRSSIHWVFRIAIVRIARYILKDSIDTYLVTLSFILDLVRK